MYGPNSKLNVQYDTIMVKRFYIVKKQLFSFRNKYSIEFELKNFRKSILDQNFFSPKHKYDNYDWFIAATLTQTNLTFFLFCASVDQSNFPLFVNSNLMILNKDKDSRKDLSKCNLNWKNVSLKKI